MYGRFIYIYIWSFMNIHGLNLGKYSIHGASGYGKSVPDAGTQALQQARSTCTKLSQAQNDLDHGKLKLGRDLPEMGCDVAGEFR